MSIGPPMNPAPVNDSSEKSSVISNIPRDESSYLGSFHSTIIDEQKKVYKKTTFKGQVLYTNTIKRKSFIDRFDEDFVTYVLQCKTTKPSDLPAGVAYVNETIVYIPEISGCLPYPEMNLVEQFLEKYRLELQGDQDPDWKKLSTKSKEKNFDRFIKSMKRLDRYPRFYSVTRKNMPQPSRGDIVMVSFIDSNDWTSSGVLLGKGVK